MKNSKSVVKNKKPKNKLREESQEVRENHSQRASPENQENQEDLASQSMRGNQKIIASQEQRENQNGIASQDKGESQRNIASQKEKENQRQLASHDNKENHARLASQHERENHKPPASHKNTENQKSIASQKSRETHSSLASQKDRENHKTPASHIKEENHMKIASHHIKETHPSLAAQNILRELGRIVAGAYYDHQQVRIQGVNRVRDVIRKKIEGIKFDEVEKKKEEKEKHKELFKDAEIPDLLNKLRNDSKITPKEHAYIIRMMEVHKNAEKHEKEYKKLMMEFVESEEIYQKFLKHIKGISAVFSANLIKEFGYCDDVYEEDVISEDEIIKHLKGDLKCPHISSLWKYCGMHVIEGEAPKRKKGVKLDFNLKLRTLVWKIGDSFIKQRTPFYRDIYDREKTRQLKIMEDSEPLEDRKPLRGCEPTSSRDPKMNSEPISSRNPKMDSESRETRKPYINSVPKNKMHCHLRAQRKMTKIFLAHYWMCCREINESIENRKPNLFSESKKMRNPLSFSEQPYASVHLGHKHISHWKEAIKQDD